MKQAKKVTPWISETTQKKFMLKMSDFFLDLAKLVFGGVIIAGIMGLGIDVHYLFIVGGLVVLGLAFAGAILFFQGNRTKKK